jgi:hypothetical protein
VGPRVTAPLYAVPMLLAVIAVDPQNDWVDYLNLVLAGVGGFASAIAIWIALRAERKADTAVTDERRRVFELEILRDLMKDVDQGLAELVLSNLGYLQRYRFRLGLISAPMPFWQQVMDAQGYFGIMEALGFDDFEAVDGRLTEAVEDRNWLASAIQLMPFLTQQGPEVLRNTSARIGKWISDPPSLDSSGQEWVETTAPLTQVLAQLNEEVPQLVKRRTEMRDAADPELVRRLAWDVEQLVLTRVEAPRPRS